MENSRTCDHKAPGLGMVRAVEVEAWLMIDDNGLEFKICRRCYDYYRAKRLKGFSYKPIPLTELQKTLPKGKVRL